MFGGFLLAIIAVFFPPVSVVIRRGCGADLVINLCLCLLAWLPGVFHAWYIIAKYPSHGNRREFERRELHSRNSNHSGNHHHHHQQSGYEYGQPPVARQGYYPAQQGGYTSAEKY